MGRAVILLLDSFGIGSSQDAVHYGDAGADTLGHIAEARANVGHPLQLPHLTRLGLNIAAVASTGKWIAGLEKNITPQGMHGYAVECSRGKDTPSGHWEITGLPVSFDWGYFPRTSPCFPASLTEDLIRLGQLPGVLGNRHASGTEIIEVLGEEHLASGRPIIYTSGDSVFQIAAHEESFGLQRLYDLCLIARSLVDEYHIGRVIARPFKGQPGKFKRTGNRRDYSTPPPAPTLLDHVITHGGEVISVGKVADIFAHRGITQTLKADGNDQLFDATLQALGSAKDHSLTFTNFVDFDTLYGHRRDPMGYAAALEAFDARLPELTAQLRPGDLVVITADHGCDPTWPGSDHTREHIPVLAFGPEVSPKFIGRRDTFADIGQTLAKHLNLAPLPHGVSFL